MRDIKSYLHKTDTVRDGFSGKEELYLAVPMGLNLNGNSGSLTIEVWRNKEAFNNVDYAGKSPNLSKNLPITQTVIENYSELFDLVKSKSLEYLGVSALEYDLQKIDIDLNILQVRFLAQHKTRINQKLTQSTATLEEFEELKNKYSEIVTVFYGFVFEYMATNEQLAKFK